MSRPKFLISIAAITLMAISFSCILAPPSALADYVRIRGSVVNVRQGPGTSFSTLYQAEEGEEYNLVSVEGLWCRVTLADGREAWVFRRLVSIIQGEIPGMPGMENPVQDQAVDEGGWGLFAFLTVFILLSGTIYLAWRWKPISRKAATWMREISGYGRNRPFRYDDRSPDKDRWEI